MFRAILFAMLMVSAATQAEVYKCPGPGGKTIYQSDPCEGGKSVEIRKESVDIDNYMRLNGEQQQYQQSLGRWEEGYVREMERQTQAIHRALEVDRRMREIDRRVEQRMREMEINRMPNR
jgi:hypothetical protein